MYCMCGAFEYVVSYFKNTGKFSKALWDISTKSMFMTKTPARVDTFCVGKDSKCSLRPKGQSEVRAVLAKQQQYTHVFNSDAHRWTDKWPRNAVWCLLAVRQMCAQPHREIQRRRVIQEPPKHANPVFLKNPPSCHQDTVTRRWNI